MPETPTVIGVVFYLIELKRLIILVKIAAMLKSPYRWAS
jgi:hypothetical protein